MAKRKVVIKVSMDGQKTFFGDMDGQRSRSKAMKIVVSVSGVESASLKGDDKDQIEVTGDGFDPVKLIKLLRKSLGHADLVSVSPVEEKKEEEKKVELHPLVWQGTAPFEYYPYPPVPVYERDPPFCSIM